MLQESPDWPGHSHSLIMAIVIYLQNYCMKIEYIEEGKGHNRTLQMQMMVESDYWPDSTVSRGH